MLTIDDDKYKLLRRISENMIRPKWKDELCVCHGYQLQLSGTFCGVDIAIIQGFDKELNKPIYSMGRFPFGERPQIVAVDEEILARWLYNLAVETGYRFENNGLLLKEAV